MPSDYVCDQCSLQWIWETEKGTLYSCSDIIINGGKIENCMGMCLNGGACVNGDCKCRVGYSGTFCEIDDNASSNWGFYILLFLVLVLIGLAVYFLIIKRFFPDKQSWLTPNNAKIEHPFNEDNPKPEVINF